MAEIIAKLGLDESKFDRGLQSATSRWHSFTRTINSQARDAGADIGKGLEKNWGARDVAKSLFAFIGFDIQELATKFSEIFTGGAQDEWKEGLRAAEEASRIIEESTLRRMNTLRQIAYIEKEIARRQPDENSKPRETPNFLSRALAKISQGLAGTPGGVVAAAASVYLGRESEAEAFKRSQTTQAKNLADQERVNQLKEKQAADEEKIAAARADLARVNMNDEQKALSLQDDMLAAYDKAAEAIMQGRDATERQIAAIGKKKALEEYLLALEQKQIAAQDRMRDLARERADLTATSEEKARGMEREAAILAERAADTSRTESQRAEDTARAAQLLNAAEAQRLQRKQQVAAIEDQIREIQTSVISLGETAGERILRLRREALFLEERSHDLSRSEQQRDADHVKAAERSAQAAQEEYNSRMRAANIADSLKTPSGRNNTTAQGVRAREATRLRAQATHAQAEGRFDAAAKFSERARKLEEDFTLTDRDGMKKALGNRTTSLTITRRMTAALVSGDVGPKQMATLSPESKQLVGIKQVLDQINQNLKPRNLE